MEIAKYVTGVDDMAHTVTVTQEAANLFTVSVLSPDDSDAPHGRNVAEFKFANAALAFKKALAVVADEVGDVVDTLEG